jgi:hypothetical protein
MIQIYYEIILFENEDNSFSFGLATYTKLPDNHELNKIYRTAGEYYLFIGFGYPNEWQQPGLKEHYEGQRNHILQKVKEKLLKHVTDKLKQQLDNLQIAYKLDMEGK